MANNLIQAPAANLPANLQDYLKQHGFDQEMAAGVSSGFGIVGYRGKVWYFKYRGEEHMQVRPDDGTPKARMDFVVVRASPSISKIFFIDGYVEGSNNPPDCWSVDGVRPDPAAANKQSTTCAGCPFDKWGSKVTQQGKSVKACTDSKRLAVVPLNDIKNEVYGGPMLLRVPAASLADMAQYENKLRSQGFPAFAVGTAIQFAAEESFPKFQFNPVRPLTAEEIDQVIAWRESDHVHRMLTGPVEGVTADVLPADAAQPGGQTLSQRAAAQPPQGQPQVGGGTLTATPVRAAPAPVPTPQPVRQAQQPVQPVAPQPVRAHVQPVQTQAVTPQGNGFFQQAEQPVQQTAQVVPMQPVQPTVAAAPAPVENAGGGFFLGGTDATAMAQGEPQAATSQGGATLVAAVDEAASGGQGDTTTTAFNALLDGLLSAPTDQPPA